jgi:hypothetical protein
MAAKQGRCVVRLPRIRRRSLGQRGEGRLFNPSSTVVKAAALLAKDGLTRQDRIARWYANHPRRNVEPPSPLPADIDAVRAQIAATFPRDRPS